MPAAGGPRLVCRLEVRDPPRGEPRAVARRLRPCQLQEADHAPALAPVRLEQLQHPLVACRAARRRAPRRPCSGRGSRRRSPRPGRRTPACPPPRPSTARSPGRPAARHRRRCARRPLAPGPAAASPRRSRRAASRHTARHQLRAPPLQPQRVERVVRERSEDLGRRQEPQAERPGASSPYRAISPRYARRPRRRSPSARGSPGPGPRAPRRIARSADRCTPPSRRGDRIVPRDERAGIVVEAEERLQAVQRPGRPGPHARARAMALPEPPRAASPVHPGFSSRARCCPRPRTAASGHRRPDRGCRASDAGPAARPRARTAVRRAPALDVDPSWPQPTSRAWPSAQSLSRRAASRRAASAGISTPQRSRMPALARRGVETECLPQR